MGKNAYRILVGKLEVKKPLGRPRRRWVHNFKMDLRQTGGGGIDWIDLSHNWDQWRALLNMVMNLRAHKLLGSSSVAAELAASEEGLSSMKLVF
jgi:hypothetical protein